MTTKDAQVLDYSRANRRPRGILVGLGVLTVVIAAAVALSLKRWLDGPEQMVVVAGLPNPHLDARADAASNRIGLILSSRGIRYSMFGSAGYAVAVPKSKAQAARALIKEEAERNAGFAAIVTTAPGEGWSGAPVQP